MILGIDASRANLERRTGVEWYAYHLIEALKQVVPPDVTVRLYSREPLTGELAVLPPHWESWILRWPPKYLWTLLRLSWEMLRRPPDLLLVPAHVLPLVLPRRVVTTIHDIGFDRYPELYPRRQVWYHRWNVRRALRRCTKVLTISEWTKSELSAVYGPSGSLVAVIPLAVDASRYRRGLAESEGERLASHYEVKQPYFIFVGRLEGKKNVMRLLPAFAKFKTDDRQGYALVLVGPPGNSYAAIRRWCASESCGAAVRYLGVIAEEDLPALLAGATALVFPTLYEGFGLPILEAMAVGTPVITSDRGANRETAGEAALLVDPLNVAAIAEAMRRMASDAVLVETLRPAGFKRAAEFSWQRTAEQTWQILGSL